MSPASASGATITAIGQVALTVKDVQRALIFYRDVLGLPFLFEAGNMAFFDCGGVRLMLTLSENSGATYASILYYKTVDIHATSAALTEKGVTFESPAHLIAKMPDHDLWMAFLKDSEGNLLGLMSEVRS